MLKTKMSDTLTAARYPDVKQGDIVTFGKARNEFKIMIAPFKLSKDEPRIFTCRACGCYVRSDGFKHMDFNIQLANLKIALGIQVVLEALRRCIPCGEPYHMYSPIFQEELFFIFERPEYFLPNNSQEELKEIHFLCTELIGVQAKWPMLGLDREEMMNIMLKCKKALNLIKSPGVQKDVSVFFCEKSETGWHMPLTDW